MMTWPTPIITQMADVLPQAYLLIHIGQVLIDIGLAEDFDDYCVHWLGQTPYLFHVPFEFVWLDDEMRKRLISILSEEFVAADGCLDYAKTPDEHDELYVSLQKLGALRELVDAIPKLY